MKLMPDRSGHRVGNTIRVAAARALPGQALQLLLSGLTRIGLGRILVAQLVEGECAAVKDFLDPVEGSRMPLEQTLHLGRILQMPIRIALQPDSPPRRSCSPPGCR